MFWLKDSLRQIVIKEMEKNTERKEYQRKYTNAFQVISNSISNTLDAVRQAEKDLKLESFINTTDEGKQTKKACKIFGVQVFVLINPAQKTSLISSF